MKLFDALAHQRRFLYLAVALLSVLGIWSAFRLPSAIYPELDFPRITIVAKGTSLSARQMVFSVTRPLEEAVSVVPSVERVRSRSIRGGSELSIYFTPGTDMVVALQMVEGRVNQARSSLPAELDIETERMLPSLFPILTYNLEGPDPAVLYDLARYTIRPALSGVPGVGRVNVQGSDVREIEVVADPVRLASAGLSYTALADAIRGALGVAMIGRTTDDYRQYLVMTDNAAHTPEQVAAVAISPSLLVQDVADVRVGIEDRTSLIRGDGRPATLIDISRQPGGNTLLIADSVAARARALEAVLPEGVRLKVVYDQASLVREAVGSVRDAMHIGAVLVVLVLLLFLHEPRITAISAAAIPITMAITVFGMHLLGQTFNLMSLGGMAVAIGLVIDDAVVVTENIVRHLELTEDRELAVREALRELVWPVTTSTFTTVVVFLPLGLLRGVVGQFFAALTITLTVAVLVSLVLALTLVPMLARQFVRAPVRGRAPGRVQRALERITDGYGRSLDRVLHHPRRVLVVAVVLVIAGGVAQHYVGTGFLPIVDEGSFVLDYVTPGGTALTETDRQLHLVESILGDTPEVAGTSRRTGSEMGMFATDQNTGDIVVRLKPYDERDRDIFEVIADVRERVHAAVPRLRVEFIQILTDVINDLAGNPEPIEIKLFGDRLEALEAYAAELAPELEKVDGVVDLYNGVAERNPEEKLKVDAAAAATIGLLPSDVVRQVDAALLGAPAGDLWEDDRTVGIRVRAPDAVRFNARRLGTIPIYGADTRTPTPLSALATTRRDASPAELLREDGSQMIAVTAGVEGRSLGATMDDVRAVLAEHAPPPGIRLVLGGQYAGQRSAFKQLLGVLALATLCVLAVMLIQFESFIEPAVIVLVAPLSFVGAISLLLATGTQFNVSSFMGLILLVGLIVKNGIILLDFTRRRMRFEGEPLGVALRAAARTRLRPILMTTLCTLLGLLPLALGSGAGSELQRPLALTVIGGLALSTPITLYMVPALLVRLRGEHATLARSDRGIGGRTT